LLRGKEFIASDSILDRFCGIAVGFERFAPQDLSSRANLDAVLTTGR
jgi:hypothetical protein